jgi:hypothetical protein
VTTTPPLATADVTPAPLVQAKEEDANHKAVRSATDHNVFESPDLLVRLLTHETEVGYKLVTFYTACATLYVAVTGVAAQQYFNAALQHPEKAAAIAWFGLTFALISLAAPFGLRTCRKEIQERVDRYANALSIPSERFMVVRFGTWLSLLAFAAIAAGWMYLVIRGL